jgi:hypothetical protein
MDDGSRWLARLKSHRLDHVQRIEAGRRKIISKNVVSGLVVKSEPDKVAASANVVAGKMVVLMSDLVIRWAVSRW